jgi:benzoyl-CoA reductase/2-hydroxyglutaryl-CoA dehydratase subunit BcrC/BadD/HgdB
LGGYHITSELDITSVGITSTIPIEVPLVADVNVVDMNNRFITSLNPKKLVQKAEQAGLSFNLCGWVKGLFSLGMGNDFDKIIVVDGGDCADLVALADFWEENGVDIIYFNYPKSRKWTEMKAALTNFTAEFDVTLEEASKAQVELSSIRSKLHELDRLTWQEGKVTGWENHLYLVQSSDFGGDPQLFDRALDKFIEEAVTRSDGFAQTEDDAPRLGFVGVPPIITDFYQRLEKLGGRIVYNETQHQFSMPYFGNDIVELYLKYTYPYGGRARLEFIQHEILKRKIDGLILYSENFCYKSIVNTYLKSHLDIPVIEIEGKSPEKMDARTQLRLEAFIEMLKAD